MADPTEGQNQEEPITLPANTPLTTISDSDSKRQHDLRALAGALIMNEQSLVNNRMTWLMTFQGLLFASFALTASTTNDPEIKTIITDIVPYAGMVVATMTLLGVIAAFLAITRTKEGLEEKLSIFPVRDQMGLIPHGTPVASFLGRATTYSFPAIIAATWLIIAIRVHKVKVFERNSKAGASASTQPIADSARSQADSENASVSRLPQRK